MIAIGELLLAHGFVVVALQPRRVLSQLTLDARISETSRTTR